MGFIRLGTKPPLAVAPNDTVTQAAIAMTGRKVGAATVVEGEAIVGVITERDVMGKVVAVGRDPTAVRVRDIMSSPALCVQLRTSVADAAEMMREHHIRHLVVVDENGKLAAMLALRYLLYDLMDDMHRNVGDLVGFIMSDGPGG
ncbi:MAG TPA: CBS domain-containing protein [Burkholderiales bacterium]|nr:CBS domain-containing protein [Burkholderiales bacterium]